MIDLNKALSVVNLTAPSGRSSGASAVATVGALDLDNEETDDALDDDDDEETPVKPGPLIPRSDATVGLEVAVPFLHERHGETHYRGVVSAIRAHSYLVKFPEVDGKWTRPWTVADDRLFSIAGA